MYVFICARARASMCVCVSLSVSVCDCVNVYKHTRVNNVHEKESHRKKGKICAVSKQDADSQRLTIMITTRIFFLVFLC